MSRKLTSFFAAIFVTAVLQGCHASGGRIESPAPKPPVDTTPLETTIEVNYDIADSDALASAKFTWIEQRIGEGEIPFMDGIPAAKSGKPTGTKLLKMVFVRLPQCHTVWEAFDELEALGLRPMTLREFCAFIGNDPPWARGKEIELLGSLAIDTTGLYGLVPEYDGMEFGTGSMGNRVMGLRLLLGIDNAPGDRWLAAVRETEKK